MALSDWDLLCINQEGKSFAGPLTNKDGNSVEVYKNRLYIHAPQMWTPGDSAFSQPVIAQVMEGEVHLAGFEIYAARSKIQNAVLTLVMSYLPGDKFDRKIEGGIGAYGWEDDVYEVLKKLGRLDEYDKYHWISGWSSETGDFIENLDTREVIEHEHETKYVGVRPETLEEYKAWIKTLELGSEVANWLAKVDQHVQWRQNQFDGQSSETIIGTDEQEEPNLVKLIKK